MIINYKLAEREITKISINKQKNTLIADYRIKHNDNIKYDVGLYQQL